MTRKAVVGVIAPIFIGVSILVIASMLNADPLTDPILSYVGSGGSMTQADWGFEYNGGDSYITFDETAQVRGGGTGDHAKVEEISLKFYMLAGATPKAPFGQYDCPYYWSSGGGCRYSPFKQYGTHTQGYDISGLRVEINDELQRLTNIHAGDTDVYRLYFTPVDGYYDRSKIRVYGRIYINRIGGSDPDPDPDPLDKICCDEGEFYDESLGVCRLKDNVFDGTFLAPAFGWLCGFIISILQFVGLVK